MRSSSYFPRVLFALILVVLPSEAAAQSSISGVVKDTSGAVLPGVTVEASSPALIEKVRTVTTDSQGIYNIVDLRPGTYVVTFSIQGFSTIKREGLELPAAFAATVNADMQVGNLAETISVTGEAPVVDLRSTGRQQTVSQELLANVPTGSTVQSTRCCCRRSSRTPVL